MSVPYKIVSDFGTAVKSRRIRTEINGLTDLSTTNPWEACSTVSKLLHKTTDKPLLRCKIFEQVASIVPALAQEPAAIPYMLNTVMPAMREEKEYQAIIIGQCATVTSQMMGGGGWQALEMVNQIYKHTGDTTLVKGLFNGVSSHSDIKYFPELSKAFGMKSGTAAKKQKKKSPAQTATAEA